MKRFFSVIFGILFLLIGLLLTASGTYLAATGGTQGKIMNPAGSAAGSGSALLFNDFAVDTGGIDTGKLADMAVGAKSLNGKELFIGLASTSDVITYLNDVPRDAVTGISTDHATVTPIPGSATARPPAEETIWTNSAQGMEPSIILPSATAGSTLVVMNVDGSPNVSMDLTVGVDSPRVFYASVALAVIGIILIIIAILLFRKAGKLKRQKKAAKLAQAQAQAAAAQQPAPGQVPAQAPQTPAAPGTQAAPPVAPQVPPTSPAPQQQPPVPPQNGPQQGQPPQPPTPPAPGA
ncbi:MAG: hypothetical protein WAS05_05645 [Candidatus Nanopelagicales bacterium]